MGRAPCCDKTKVKRGPWSPEEDSTLKNYIHSFGTGGNWIALPHKAGLKRCGKSCRLRWLNYLRPDIKHGGFTEEEDNTILTLYSTIGSRWSVIASHLQGRTDNDVKNHWNTKLKKKLLAANTSHVLNFSSSTVPSAPFLPKEVDNYYYSYYGNNSDVYNNYCDDQKNLVLDPHDLLLVSNQVQVSSSTLPGLMEIPDQIGSSHEFSSISSFGNRDGFCGSDDNGGGEEEDGFLMDLSGSGFSFNNFVNGFDFHESLSAVCPNLANSH